MSTERVKDSISHSLALSSAPSVERVDGVRATKALDLFCGAGGASMGLYRAGFDVTGVDIKPQPRYPFKFIQADALMFPLEGFDFIWASPMCQRYSLGSLRWGKKWPDQIRAVRKALRASGAPFVIENVPRAPLINPIILCGTMFGLRVVRHRAFESNVSLSVSIHHCAPRGCTKRKEYATVAGHGGFGSNSLPVWKAAMDIDWMSKVELSQAIPPAYSEYIGRQVLEGIGERERETVGFSFASTGI